MDTPTVDALSLVVSDMARSVAFYRRLGCPFPPGCESEGHASAPLGDGFTLMLDVESVVEGFADWPLTRGTRSALAARCAGPAQVDQLYAELAAEGQGVKEPWDAVWGMRYAVVRDPDGAHVDLYADLPAADG